MVTQNYESLEKAKADCVKYEDCDGAYEVDIKGDGSEIYYLIG